MFPKNKYVQNLVFLSDTILDEMIFGGQVMETSSTELVKAVEEILRCPLCVCVCVCL